MLFTSSGETIRARRDWFYPEWMIEFARGCKELAGGGVFAKEKSKGRRFARRPWSRKIADAQNLTGLVIVIALVAGLAFVSTLAIRSAAAVALISRLTFVAQVSQPECGRKQQQQCVHDSLS
jgi:hypothetical protein